MLLVNRNIMFMNIRFTTHRFTGFIICVFHSWSVTIKSLVICDLQYRCTFPSVYEKYFKEIPLYFVNVIHPIT